MCSSPAASTRTRVHVHQVDACCSILTRIARALVNVSWNLIVYRVINESRIHTVITNHTHNMQLFTSLLWHWVPVYPSSQVQLYMLIWSLHVAPLKHGLLSHSLISSENVGGSKLNLTIVRREIVYSEYLPRQCVPVQPDAQMHVYMFKWSTHVDPALHGLLAHSSTAQRGSRARRTIKATNSAMKKANIIIAATFHLFNGFSFSTSCEVVALRVG